MEQKIRIAIIGLVVLILICIIAIFQVYSSKQTLERQIDRLNNENKALQQQTDQISTEKRQLDQQLNNLKDEINKASSEKDELLKKYDLVNRAREDLLEQIKSLKAKTVSQPAQAEQPVFSISPGGSSEDAYWGSLIKQKTDLELQLSSVREELKKLQIGYEQAQREKGTLELDITGLNRDKQDLKRQIEYNQKIMDSVTSELVREKNDKTQIENSLKTIKAENVTLRRQVKALSNRKIELERKIAELQSTNDEMEHKTTQVDELLKDKLAQIDNIKEQITQAQGNQNAQGGNGEESKTPVILSPIVVRPPADSFKDDASSSKVGKITAVNRENNFVIINIGENSGLKVGDNFQAYRDGKAIARLEVIQVRQSIAACDIKKEAITLKVGDTVR